jgi:ankyrin repeat protein
MHFWLDPFEFQKSESESEYSDDLDDLCDQVLEQDPKQRYLNDGLHYALETGNFNDVKMFIKYGANCNAESASSFIRYHRKVGREPLEIAAENDDTEVFNYLLDHGADPGNQWISFIYNELDLSIMFRFYAKHPCVFKRAISMINGPKQIEEVDRKGLYRLAAAIIEQETQNAPIGIVYILKLLLELEPANLLVPEDDKPEVKSLLRIAVECKSLRCLKVILKMGIKVNYCVGRRGVSVTSLPLDVVCNFRSERNSPDILPLHIASANDSLDIVMFLLESGEMCIKSVNLHLPVDMAYKHLSTNVLRFFLLNGFTSERIERDRLHVACFLEDAVRVKTLIKDGAGVNALDGEGRTPLVIAIRMKNIYLIKLLLQSGARPGTNKPGDLSAIVAAVKEGNAEILDAILSSNRKIDLNDPKQNFLHLSITANNQETFNKLLHLGVDISVLDKDGYSPIHRVSQLGNYKMLKALIERGANVNAVRWRSSTYEGHSALGMCKDPNCIRLLLEHIGEDVHIRKHYGSSAGVGELFEKTIRDCHGDLAIMKVFEKVCPGLVEDISVFGLACREGFHDLIKYLLSKNPTFKIKCHLVEFFPWQKDEFTAFNKTMKLLLDLGCVFNFSRRVVCGVKEREDRERLGAEIFTHQVFLFTKIVHERCGRNDEERFDRRGFLRLMMRMYDRHMVTLLRDCGLEMELPMPVEQDLSRIFFFDDNDRAKGVKYTESINQIARQPISLQNRCRVAIRRTLCSLKPKDSDIREEIEQLPLVECMREFLNFSGHYQFQYLRYCS